MCESLSILNTLSAASAAADSSWVETFSSGMENLNPNAPFSEKLLYGLKIALIGIVVVFLILAKIYYTTNGQTASSSYTKSHRYKKPFTISKKTTIKAIAVKDT